MLSQSFSPENFRIILDAENRKGIYLEDKDKYFDNDFFRLSREKANEIIKVNSDIKDEKLRLKVVAAGAKIDYAAFNLFKENKEILKEKLRSEKEIILLELLKEISKEAENEDYEIEISKGAVKFGKQLYITNKKVAGYFVLKQVQYNIHKTFKVKQADRYNIVSQLKLLLSDGFPKIIIRTDIKSFYESIPHKQLIERIDENSLLNYPSKKVIKSILNQYWKILIEDGLKNPGDERVGVPRGIGISANLSELFMRSIDKRIKALKYVTYYARYVDDIIMIITPINKSELKSVEEYKNEIKEIIEYNSNLKLNKAKTSTIDFRDVKAPVQTVITYLGYNFILGYENKVEGTKTILVRQPLEVKFSDEKYKRYKQKINTVFEDYKAMKATFAGRENTTNRLLYQRILYLTSNTKLAGRKSNVFVGIKFSNAFLSEPLTDLRKLDKYLQQQIKKLSAIGTTAKISDKLALLSFYKGFKDQIFVRFKAKSFESILKIWENI